MNFPDPATAPRFLRQAPCAIAASECRAALRASLPAVMNHLQEAAGLHAQALGVGIRELQAQGFTWMLGRLALKLNRLPAWQEPLTLATWPNGVKGRLLAERQFALETPSGERLLEASSEWLYVNFQTGRLARLPETVLALATPGTAAFALCQERLPEPDLAVTPLAECRFAVRRAEIDANGHVNNVHYAEWMLETLPEATYFGAEPVRFDIAYKQAAKLGDEVLVRTWASALGHFIHAVFRATDGTLLAHATSAWQGA
ncbi:MAG: acyl-[acyl-carrier-protein] thioesterase [Candidatus Spyradenecus sp.]